MIVDRIENAEYYRELGERMALGLKLIQDSSLYGQATGTYQVDGDDLYYMIQRYTTRSPGDTLFEAHREYADIQAVVEGGETIGWAPVETLQVVQPYKPDICKYANPDSSTAIRMLAGTFAIFYPQDGHQPCCDLGAKGPVVKMVVKVRL